MKTAVQRTDSRLCGPHIPLHLKGNASWYSTEAAVAEFTATVHAHTGVDHTGYSVRQATYDLRKLRGKQLIDKPSRSRRYVVSPLAARTIAALLTLREQVIAPIHANLHSSKMGRKPAHWTRVDRDYERIRIDMQTLFTVLAIETPLPT